MTFVMASAEIARPLLLALSTALTVLALCSERATTAMPLIDCVPWLRFGSLAGVTEEDGSTAFASLPLSMVAALPVP